MAGSSTEAFDNRARVEALIAQGVSIPAPEAVVVTADVVLSQIEAGAVLYPGVVLRGGRTRVGAGSQLGLAGGGCFDDVAIGRGVTLYGGIFEDAVLLDGVTVRGHAELRGGTVMEEGSEAAHHVGYKMTHVFPWVVAGSLINFCDALFAGGTSRSDHSEIGSCLALYNYTPWGDKFASMFGDVPRGVFLRSPRVFVGGQTQIVSPVRVGYGSLIPAGLALRRTVGDGRICGEAARDMDAAFDTTRYGALRAKVALTAEYVANLHALRAWYDGVRLPAAPDAFTRALWEAAARQIDAGIAERIKRLGRLVDRLPTSLEAHRATPPSARRDARIAEHEALIASWPSQRGILRAPPGRDAVVDALAPVSAALAEALSRGTSYPDAVVGLDAVHVATGSAALQGYVDAVLAAAHIERVAPDEG